jgi:SAM-dependent methyltransferase
VSRRTDWEGVKELMEAAPVEFGQHIGYWLHQTPRRMLHSTSYYKFAAKMIGRPRRVLDIGCGEGLGTWLLAVECGAAVGADLDADAIACARRAWTDPRIGFRLGDAFEAAAGESWDAVVSFDVIEHVEPARADAFLDGVAGLLDPSGVAIVGTPNETSARYASAVTNAGHVNLYSGERLLAALRERFRFAFLFGANDEVVHTGFTPMAHYLLVLACGVR